MKPIVFIGTLPTIQKRTKYWTGVLNWINSSVSSNKNCEHIVFFVNLLFIVVFYYVHSELAASLNLPNDSELKDAESSFQKRNQINCWPQRKRLIIKWIFQFEKRNALEKFVAKHNPLNTEFNIKSCASKKS